MFYSMKEWRLKGFERSQAKNKKYAAILENRNTGQTRRANFGDKRYQHYKDKALGVYSHLDHGDPKRRKNYRVRHAKDIKPGFYSPGWLSLRYLW